jgi:hypothetical protein
VLFELAMLAEQTLPTLPTLLSEMNVDAWLVHGSPGIAIDAAHARRVAS